VVQQFPKTRSAEEALIALGNLRYSEGKIDEALQIFDQYLTIFRRGRFRVMAGLGKAYAQEAKGDLQGATQTLSQLLDREKNDPLAGEAYMSLARAYEGMKKPDDAMQVYGQVVEKYPQTRWAQYALQRMSALKTK
jgi:TolA-binding protein